MKILHVIANLAGRYGGPAVVCKQMAAALAKRGHDVSVFTTNQDGEGILNDVKLNQAIFADGVEYRYFQVERPYRFSASKGLAQALAERIPHCDIVEIHSLYLFHGLVAGRICRQWKIPYVIFPHGALDPFILQRHRLRKKIAEWIFENENIARAASIRFTSPKEFELARPAIGTTPGSVIDLGLDANFAKNLAQNLKISRRQKQILFLGRITFKKGLDLLARAFRELAKGDPALKLVIAGPDDEGYRKVIAPLFGESIGQVSFPGLLQGPAKLKAFAESSVFVLPSYQENFGLTVIESLACRLPVVISDQVNICDEIKSAQAGMVIPCEVGALVHAVKDIFAQPERADEMARRGEKLVAEKYNWEKIAVNIEAQYQKLIGK